jgi:hypothetical protein
MADRTQSTNHARRAFLRGLTTLPLIGGGCDPHRRSDRAAEPITRDMLDSYETGLFYERRFLRFERSGQVRAPNWAMTTSPS